MFTFLGYLGNLFRTNPLLTTSRHTLIISKGVFSGFGFFGNFSVVSVLANLFVLPGIPLAMLLGFVSLLIFMLFPAAGVVAGSVVWLLLHAIIWIIGLCAAIPLADINNLPFPLSALIIYYVFLFTFLIWKAKQKQYSNI